MKLTLTSLMCWITLMASSQYDRGIKFNLFPMNDKVKIQYSRAWKIIGLSLIATGIYAGKNNAPQRYDVPLIGFGMIITLEGIRLKKSANDRIRNTTKIRG